MRGGQNLEMDMLGIELRMECSVCIECTPLVTTNPHTFCRAWLRPVPHSILLENEWMDGLVDGRVIWGQGICPVLLRCTHDKFLVFVY